MRFQEIKELFFKKYTEDEVGGPQKIEVPLEEKPLDTKIISILNQKGGCGKTTTVINLSACLAEMGYKSLIIDLDPQAHSSLGLGIKTENLDKHIYHVLRHPELSIIDVIHDTYSEHLKIAPSNTLLSSSLIDFVNSIGREGLLKEHTDKCRGQFDFILIDCPPSLNLLTINALTASNDIIVPIQTHYYSLEGMKELFKTVDRVKSRLNPQLEIFGILATLYDMRTKVGRTMLSSLKEYFKEKMFDAVIRINSALAEAPIYGKPVIMYDAASRGAQDYKKLAEEILIRYGESRKEQGAGTGILDLREEELREPAREAK